MRLFGDLLLVRVLITDLIKPLFFYGTERTYLPHHNSKNAHFCFLPLRATIYAKGGGNAMKYVKQPKRHIVLDDFEWRALVKGINEYRKQVIDEDGCVEVVNELLLKIIDAPTKRIKVLEVSK